MSVVRLGVLCDEVSLSLLIFVMEQSPTVHGNAR